MLVKAWRAEAAFVCFDGVRRRNARECKEMQGMQGFSWFGDEKAKTWLSLFVSVG